MADVVYLAYGKFGNEGGNVRLLGVYKTKESAELEIVKKSPWGGYGVGVAGHVDECRILE